MGSQNYKENQAVRELGRCEKQTARGICDKPITSELDQQCDYWRDHIEEGS